MKWVPINLMLSLLFMISVIAIGLFIQVKLSRSENKYLGLILLALSFLGAVLMVLGIYAFTMGSYVVTESAVTMDEFGEVIEESEEMITDSGKLESTPEDILGIGYTFLVSNIPTVILGGIYISERNKIKVNKQIEKMKINDL